LGHGILALDSELSFYIGCAFIVMGVGGLKPNISSMVGGLYPKGDERRDLGFYIFYMGINLGAFLAPLFCGWVGETYNWHYGFGLAAVGMLIGQITYFFGQKYLVGVGELKKRSTKEKKELQQKKLTPIEKDRVKVLLISFMMIIIFWGAFEQAGGLMNLYAKQKTDRMLMGFEIPASWFQALNAFFIITLAVFVGGIWMRIKSKGKEASAIFKIAVGIMIMGFGFLFMRFAASEYEFMGYSSMHWLVLAYLFHTVGELCASPVSLSYITKLAPEKYAALMMGLYFAASGLGNKLAANIGENAGDAGEKATFTGIFVFCTLFGLLVIAILKPLKRLSHGAEDLSEKTV
jgi:POT family proton-dependent oligopeptide transporter